MKKKLKAFCFIPIRLGFFVSLVVISTEIIAYSSDVVVITNPNVTENALPAKDLQMIFLGKLTKWKNGSPVEFVLLKDDIEVHDQFLKTFIGKSPVQFKNFWRHQVFTGKGQFPKNFDSESKLLEYVSSNDDVIGYVSSETALGSAKAISINH